MSRSAKAAMAAGAVLLVVSVILVVVNRRSAVHPEVGRSESVPKASAAAPGNAIFDGKQRIAVPQVAGDKETIRSLLNISEPMQYGQFVWNERGVPAGPIWVRIDLPQQILSVFRGGHEIGTAVILYGADKKPTPIGTFPILAKLRDHRSSLYDAPMPYTMRLTGDGVAIHGSNVRYGAATHGCVGVPTDFAAKLFAVVRTGDPVTIVGGKDKAPT